MVFLVFIKIGFAQTFPEGITYQAQVFSSSGGILSGVDVDVRFNVRSTSMAGPIVWQEDHTVTLSDLGHFGTNIGQGTSTGAGSAASFDGIDWAADSYFLEMLVDESMSGSFVSAMTHQMMAVPFAYHSKTTAQQYSLSELQDVDTTGVEVGDILKWDGFAWVPDQDSVASCDTVAYALQSDTAAYADTAFYASNCETVSVTFVDSADFSNYADTADFAYNAENTIYADTAAWVDTSNVALFALGNWGLEGNDNTDGTTNYLGTSDANDLIIRTNDIERMRITSDGDVGIGTASPLTDYHVNNVNGVLYSGTFGTGTIPVEGAGNRMMWYPGKAAFRVGGVTGSVWDDGFIGDYSICAGYNGRAQGIYSAAFGNAPLVTGESSFGAGHQPVVTGDFSVAIGHNPEATADYTVALGRGAIADELGAIAIGYHPEVYSPHGVGLGHYVLVNGENALATGYYSNALHDGSFIWADYSTPSVYTNTTAANQFMVKASGGVVFYSASDLSTGVELLPGAGSWSILSDRNSKENIEEVDGEEYLRRLEDIEVYEWSYKAQGPDVRHLGPMAQDFHEVFRIGTDSTRINSGDFAGINLLLLQELNDKVRELETQDDQVEDLQKQLAELKEESAKLRELLIELEKWQASKQN